MKKPSFESECTDFLSNQDTYAKIARKIQTGKNKSLYTRLDQGENV
jgi:hypothetical protein